MTTNVVRLNHAYSGYNSGWIRVRECDVVGISRRGAVVSKLKRVKLLATAVDASTLKLRLCKQAQAPGGPCFSSVGDRQSVGKKNTPNTETIFLRYKSSGNPC